MSRSGRWSGAGVRVFVCLLVFLALTLEREDFASGYWNTVMVYTRPLFRGSPVNVWDVAVGLAALALALRPATWRNQVRPLNLALLASLLALLGMAAWGVLRGGDPRMAYFQLGALLRMFLLVPILFGAFRTSRDLRLLAGTVLAAAVYRAVACILCFNLVIRTGGTPRWPDYVTDHHDSTLWVAALVGLLSWALVRRRIRTALGVGLLSLLLLLAVYYNNRRMAWLELLGGLLLAYLVIPRGSHRRWLNRWATVVAPVVLVYVVVGWGQSGKVFTPVQRVRSAMTDDRNDSNLYRNIENAGLIVTLQGSPLLGTGFGRPFVEVSTVYTSGMRSYFGDYLYLPHNSVLGLAASTGLVGFPVIWAFLSVGAFLAARARAFARRPRDQVVSTVAFAFPFIYGQQAFGDMGLQSMTANIILACALAAAGRIAVLTGAWPTRRLRSLRLTVPAHRQLEQTLPARTQALEPS